MKQDSKRRQLKPQPSVPTHDAICSGPRSPSCERQDGRRCPADRLARLLSTDKPVPKDADVLVTIDPAMDLSSLARFGRRLKGTAQTINLGADILVVWKLL